MNSTKTAVSTILPIFTTSLLTVLGQLLVKVGMIEVISNSNRPVAPDKTARIILSTLTNVKVVAGLSCAVLAALSWLIVMSKCTLSFAYPFTALSLVLVIAMSGIVLKEPVPANRWIGVAIVCIGIIIASRD